MAELVTPSQKKLMLFSGRSHPELAEHVAKELGIDVSPTKLYDFANSADVEKHDRMVSLVNRMLTLHQRKAWAKNPDTLRYIGTEIMTIDRQIDRLVYVLYDLTPDEIALVEQGAGRGPGAAGAAPGR